MASAICFNSTLVPSNHQSFIPFNTHRYFCCEFDKYHFHHATHFMYFANHLGILHKFHYISPAFCFYPHICHSVYGNTATAVAHYYHSCIPLGAHADETRNYENWFYVSVFFGWFDTTCMHQLCSYRQWNTTTVCRNLPLQRAVLT